MESKKNTIRICEVKQNLNQDLNTMCACEIYRIYSRVLKKRLAVLFSPFIFRKIGFNIYSSVWEICNENELWNGFLPIFATGMVIDPKMQKSQNVKSTLHTSFFTSIYRSSKLGNEFCEMSF